MTQKIIIKIRFSLVASLVGLAVLFVLPKTSYAGSLNFTPASSSVATGGIVTVKVDINAGTDQIAGTDIYITYDDAILDLQSVTGAGYFPLVSNIPSTGKLYVSGVVANQGEFKTGIGSVASLVFKGANEGSTDLKFECDLTKIDTSKIVKNDINASNVIDCSVLKAHTVTVGVGSSTSTSSDPQPTDLPESGTYDSLMQYSAVGGVLLVMGFLARLFLRI